LFDDYLFQVFDIQIKCRNILSKKLVIVQENYPPLKTR